MMIRGVERSSKTGDVLENKGRLESITEKGRLIPKVSPFPPPPKGARVELHSWTIGWLATLFHLWVIVVDYTKVGFLTYHKHNLCSYFGDSPLRNRAIEVFFITSAPTARRKTNGRIHGGVVSPPVGFVGIFLVGFVSTCGCVWCGVWFPVPGTGRKRDGETAR